MRYTGPPRGGPSIGDFICIITKSKSKTITTIKVPASLRRLEVLAVELHPSAETATKLGQADKLGSLNVPSQSKNLSS